MKTIKLDNEIQVQIFLCLYEYPKGLCRSELTDKLKLPRTTIYDNLKPLFNKTLNNIPYIKFYSVKSGYKGRPIILFYIPKGIRNNYLNFKIIEK